MPLNVFQKLSQFKVITLRFNIFVFIKVPKIRAIVYQTYSKNSSENEILISKALEEFNENRKSLAFPYK